MNTDKKPITTAKEAVGITNQNALTFDFIMDQIQSQANYGSNCFYLIDKMMPFDIMKKVMDAGFIIGQSVNPMGNNVIRISW